MTPEERVANFLDSRPVLAREFMQAGITELVRQAENDKLEEARAKLYAHSSRVCDSAPRDLCEERTATYSKGVGWSCAADFLKTMKHPE